MLFFFVLIIFTRSRIAAKSTYLFRHIHPSVSLCPSYPLLSARLSLDRFPWNL